MGEENIFGGIGGVMMSAIGRTVLAMKKLEQKLEKKRKKRST